MVWRMLLIQVHKEVTLLAWYDSIVNTVKSSFEAQFVKKSSTSGLVRNDGSVDTSTHLKSTDIVDNLVTNDASKPLSAKQGKVLYDLIGDIEEDMLS